MIPTWQIVGLIILSLIGLAVGVYSAPNSFAYLSLTGQCAGAGAGGVSDEV
jgi:hypothetical protein